MKITDKIYGRINQIRGYLYRILRRKRIVMIHEGRSGSSVLGLMLDDHPGIHWAGEILKRQRVYQYKKNRPVFDYKEVIRRDEEKSFKKCYGFEMKYLHMRELGISKTEFLQTADALGYTHFIILTRRNGLRRLTSEHVAKAAGYHRLPTDKQRELVRVTIDPTNLIDQFRRYSADVHDILELLKHRKHLHLIYEEDVQADPAIAFAKIMAFLQLPAYPIAPKIQRINIYHPREMIINFDEVVAALNGTEYAWMLEL